MVRDFRTPAYGRTIRRRDQEGTGCQEEPEGRDCLKTQGLSLALPDPPPFSALRCLKTSCSDCRLIAWDVHYDVKCIGW